MESRGGRASTRGVVAEIAGAGRYRMVAIISRRQGH